MDPALLKAAQEMRNWSQSRVAEAVGVSIRTLSRWETGIAIPRPYYREQLCALFGKNASELGLYWEVEENDVVRKVPSSLSQISTLNVLLQEPLLIDPAFPEALGDANSLLGRDDLFIQVKHLLLAGDNVVLRPRHGLSGIGTTALAVALATDQEVQAHFPDGILWAGLGPQPNVLSHLTRWGTLLGTIPVGEESPKSREAWGRALRRAIGQRRLLLIIDDAWTTEDTLALQVGGPQCSHLLTTRLSKVAFSFMPQRAIIVPELEDADGMALLARFVPQLVQQDPEGAQAQYHSNKKSDFWKALKRERTAVAMRLQKQHNDVGEGSVERRNESVRRHVGQGIWSSGFSRREDYSVNDARGARECAYQQVGAPSRQNAALGRSAVDLREGIGDHSDGMSETETVAVQILRGC